jgi:hypothetical protein
LIAFSAFRGPVPPGGSNGYALWWCAPRGAPVVGADGPVQKAAVRFYLASPGRREGPLMTQHFLSGSFA